MTFVNQVKGRELGLGCIPFVWQFDRAVDSSMTRKRKLGAGLPLISLTDVRSGTTCPAPIVKGNNSDAGGKPTFTVEPTELPQSSRPWLAPRRDTPICNYTRRAKAIDNEDIWTEQQRDKALKELQRDYLATSAKGPAISALKTWEKLHWKMHDTRTPVYPLTPEKITRVAAAFKALGYRSFPNYLARAKEAHIQMFGDWTVSLNFEAKRASRSVGRGIGPSSQRTPLAFESIVEEQGRRPLGMDPLVVNGTFGPHNLAIVGTYFLLREAEASLLLCGNVTVNQTHETVTLRLPSSKNDPAAASVERTWGCLCNAHGKFGCPYHCALDQWEELNLTFGSPIAADLPFFPRRDGTTVDKTKVVETLENLHRRCGLPIQDYDGAPLLGGHSMRLAGACFLAAAGLHPYQIELMARWNSPMLVHYAKSAPLKKITQEYLGLASNHNMAETIEDLKRQMDEIRTDLCCPQQQNDIRACAPEIETRFRDLQDGIQEMELKYQEIDFSTRKMIQEEIDQIRNQIVNRPCEYIQNLSSGTWHSVLIDGLGYHPTSWATKCGWKFGMAPVVRSSALPKENSKLCDKCFQMQFPSSELSDDTDSD